MKLLEAYRLVSIQLELRQPIPVLYGLRRKFRLLITETGR